MQSINQFNPVLSKLEPKDRWKVQTGHSRAVKTVVQGNAKLTPTTDLSRKHTRGANKALTGIDGWKVFRDGAVVFVLIAITIAVATALASFS